MARRKTTMKLIENARSRATTYAKRTKGLQKKASELSKLCGVPVALVCAPAPGAGAGSRLVWESEEGVLDRYRAAVLTPETRARHTHRSYLETELGKERAKLARVRPGALPDWDPALNDMTLDDARKVLDAIDATLRSTGDRMVTLGLPADGRLDDQVALVAVDDDASHDAAFAPQLLALEDMDMGTGFHLQMLPYHCQGENNGSDGLLEQFLMQPEYGLQCVGGGGSYDASAVDKTQAQAGYGDNAGCGWPNQTMCYAADRSWNAVMPVGYYPHLAAGALAAGHYSAQGVTSGDYADTLQLEYPMGNDENFACADMDNSYAAHWQAEEFQHSGTGTGTGTGHYQCSDPGTYSSGQVFNYFY